MLLLVMSGYNTYEALWSFIVFVTWFFETDNDL